MKKGFTILLFTTLCCQFLAAQNEEAKKLQQLDSIKHAMDASSQDDTAGDYMYNTADSAVVDTSVATEEMSEEVTGDVASVDTNTHKFVRHYMDEDKLAALRRDKDFSYEDIDSAMKADMRPQKATTLPFAGFDASILLWLLVAFAVVIVVMQFSNINMRRLFGSPKMAAPNRGEDHTENIHDINFDEEIRNAIAAQNFPLAARLMYLKALKKLADKGFIILHINKTNWHYVQELKSKPVQDSFQNITTIFEYIRYGNMEVSHEKFRIIEHAFADFNNKVY